jgi:hypothetical protein
MNTLKNILSIQSQMQGKPLAEGAHITDVHEESIQTSNLEVFNYTKQVARYLI